MSASTNSHIFRIICLISGESDKKQQDDKDFGHAYLNETGIKQVKKASKVLSNYKISRIYSSDRRTARESCALIFPKDVSLPDTLVTEDLRENNLADPGTQISEVSKKLNSLNVSVEDYYPGQTDDNKNLCERIMLTFMKVCQHIYGVNFVGTIMDRFYGKPKPTTELFTKDSYSENDIAENILMVTHGETLREFFRAVKEMKWEFPKELDEHLYHGGISKVVVRLTAGNWSYYIEEYNAHDHLGELAAQQLQSS